MNVLQIKDLSKRYTTSDGDVVALDRVSLHVSAGEFVAIIGRSGAGKTTLLNMIAGLDVPDEGSILLDGVDVVSLSAAQTAKLRRRKIGVIYQFYNLIPELTVIENVALPKELDGERIDPVKLAERLSTVGLANRGGAYPAQLSGGQQQRVAIARALFQAPSLILADEPTGNLDGESGREILALLTRINREQGVTVLVVTHSNAVAQAADRIITITDGAVTQDCRTEQGRQA